MSHQAALRALAFKWIRILYSIPHFTTIAEFIARSDDEIERAFRDVLLVCNELGLIGREMFAVDGVKLPSNAYKEWSGTREDFQKKVAKLERAVGVLTERHRQDDAQGAVSDEAEARVKQMETLTRVSAKIRAPQQNLRVNCGSGRAPRV